MVNGDVVRRVLRLLVVEVLAGRRGLVRALYDYVVGGMSIGRAADRYGFTVNQLRSLYGRLRHDIGASDGVIRIVLIRFAGKFSGIRPAVSGYKCLLCGAVLERDRVSFHISVSHRDFVDGLVNILLGHSEEPVFDGRVKVISVKMPLMLLDALDVYVRRNGITRSEAIRRAVSLLLRSYAPDILNAATSSWKNNLLVMTQ